jgi:hypothetical protein
MQDGGFNPDKIHDKLDEILKTASALDRKQYSHALPPILPFFQFSILF